MGVFCGNMLRRTLSGVNSARAFVKKGVYTSYTLYATYSRAGGYYSGGYLGLSTKKPPQEKDVGDLPSQIK